MIFFLHDPPHFYRGSDGEEGTSRADRLRQTKKEELTFQQSTLEDRFEGQELEYAQSFFFKILTPLFDFVFDI